MRTRSQSRSLPDAGDHGRHTGSAGIIAETRSRRRRRSDSLGSCAEYEVEVHKEIISSAPSFGRCTGSDCLKKPARRRPSDKSSSYTGASLFEGFDQTLGVTEWRDWTSLEAGLVEDIAGRLLALDVAEYLRFRAACKPWRNLSDDPCGGLDSRFRPRDWIDLSYCDSPSRRTLLNVTTGARMDVDFPELSTHHQMGSAEGLLVLCHKATNVIRLLNPLTGVFTEFPAITDVRALSVPPAAHVSLLRASHNFQLGSLKVHVPNPFVIKGAGIDDSTSPPTLVLCLRRQMSHIVCAKPGDGHWVSVDHGEQDIDLVTYRGQILFHSLLSFKGCCYVTTPRGDIMTVDLSLPDRPCLDRGNPFKPPTRKPRMVYLLREAVLGDKVQAWSYLVRSQDRMLMVRHSLAPHISDLVRDCDPGKVFTARGLPSRIDVFEVDLTARQLIPLGGIGDHAVFLGETRTIMLSTNKFPKIIADAVYMEYTTQRYYCFGAYRIKDGTTMPPADLRRDKGQRTDAKFLPCACHLELGDYLICYVQMHHHFHCLLFVD